MHEHNNRKLANKFAEYITGQELRKYTARKIHQYVGTHPTVFDGAIGSGQLEQFVEPSFVTGVELQESACETFEMNHELFPNRNIHNMSFFNFKDEVVADCVVMNPPFSIKFKDLSDEEKSNIQEGFPWKKSGVVDDIFVLKSLKHTSRYGFYILFPGVGYRKTETMFRTLIGNQLQELNVIRNAFEDTSIDVLFLVVDKNKTSQCCKRELYDCKVKKVVVEDEWEILERWETINEEVEKEEVDIDAVNVSLDKSVLSHLQRHLEYNLLLIQEFKASIDYLGFINKCYALLDQYSLEYQFNVPIIKGG